MNPETDIWQGRVLTGCVIASASPRLTMLAAQLGFHSIWIDMEHASTDLRSAEQLCIASEAGGAIPIVRTTGWRREHVLQALEIGGRIIVVPMVNDAERAREIVEFGRYPPEGRRGFFSHGRAEDFGLAPAPEMMARANARTVIMPQIETKEAVAQLDAILKVPGIGGIFIGPGDLSTTLGYPGDLQNPELLRIVSDCIRKARQAGLHAGILAMPGKLLDTCVSAGADLCLMGSDVVAARTMWRDQLAKFGK